MRRTIFANCSALFMLCNNNNSIKMSNDWERRNDLLDSTQKYLKYLFKNFSSALITIKFKFFFVLAIFSEVRPQLEWNFWREKVFQTQLNFYFYAQINVHAKVWVIDWWAEPNELNCRYPGEKGFVISASFHFCSCRILSFWNMKNHFNSQFSEIHVSS